MTHKTRAGQVTRPISDRDLILACRKGDADAWKTLVGKYQRLVYTVAMRCGLSSHDAADITQLTFSILVQSLDDLWDDTYLGAWMTTVARRHAWRLRDRRRRETLGDEDIASTPPPGAEIAVDPTPEWDRILWLQRGMAGLAERCRELLRALYLNPEQPSYEQVAAEFGMRVGSVGPTRARCLQRLKELLDPK